MKGKVKWFNEGTGYGFIEVDTDGREAFVHYTEIRTDGFKTLQVGQDVQFDAVETSRGLSARNVVLGHSGGL